ncbi:MAG: fasciclin domain-containing protein [Bacteroidaceae bacterium]|nr:fasciclin domain-containing protein [Bacteroidaceae bacterium]
MDKKTFFSIIRSSLLGAAFAVTFTACEDDHFTVNDGGGAGANATLTLWQQIQKKPELSRFREIAEKTPYFKDEGHVVKGYTFANVLDGTQNLTVFAPTNTALSEAEYQGYMTMLQGSTSDQYDVFLRLIGNHITRNRYSATGTGQEDLVMINGKRATFDHAAKTFKDIQLAEVNIPATNGTLHTMNTLSPFAYNIYEYIKANPGEYGKVREWLMSFDTLYFDSYASAEGGSDSYGNPIYVDSIYSRENSLFGFQYSKRGEEWIMNIKGLNGNIEREDSIWAMALPTDLAWNAAWEAMKDNYDYSELYIDKEKEDQGNSGQTFGGSADSLRTLGLSMDLVAPLLFNARLQLETTTHSGFWTAEQFKQAPMNKLFNARQDTFTVDYAATRDVKELLFDGNNSPVEVSNGLVYKVNNWNFWKPFRTKDVEMKLNSSYLYNLNNNTNNRATFYDFANKGALITDSLCGTVSFDENTKKTGFMAIYSTSTSAAKMEFKLMDLERDNQILSNVPYDVYVIMVPNFYYEQSQWDSLTVTPMKNRLQIQILYNDGSVNARGAVTEKKTTAMQWEYDGLKVDTICISKQAYPEGLVFPKSYKNITRSFPILTVESKAKNKEAGYQHTFFIDRIIFKARE